MVDVSLTGGFLVLKHAGRVLGEGGSVISLTSLNARQPGAGMAAYCSAKAGLAMLTQVAALELGPRGIRVNAVSPGLVVTPLTAPAMDIDGIEDDYLANTPLGRSGTPEEIAEAVVFVSKAAWLTGEVLDLNGGAHLMRYPDLRRARDPGVLLGPVDPVDDVRRVRRRVHLDRRQVRGRRGRRTATRRCRARPASG